ncbi:L-dopachrome tautomerase-related protein [Clostridium sp. 1001275B_160808_H3]|uniref:L-dopachrome tautomerase-related protein n=1 Tax=Clostridium sp. 1001275B_160808_H3 TaxID=2787110 RepID=UPI001899425F|nr:L-dopachrome tautomerase-related protein [Clostridium sp. 1001275B_160808_H3]
MKHKKLPREKYFGHLEQVFAFYGPMPTGVTISEEGRIFVNFPKWGDDVKFTVAEIVKNKLVPYPNMEINKEDYNDPSKRFISVQSVVADGRGTLFVLDTASPMFSEPIKGGAKLVAVDLKTNKIRRIYTFSDDVVLPTTYLNDVRIDYRVGEEGYAYITDSSTNGQGAIIVLNLKSGEAFRRLNGDKSTSPDPNFIPKVEGEVLLKRKEDGTTEPINFSVDGIAISPNGKILYYCPLSSRNLYSIETELLRNRAIPDEVLSSYVKDLGEKGASDGLMSDARGIVYAGDYENNSIRTILLDGTMKTIAHDPRILWPDTLSIGHDKYLYFTANQLNRQADYHYGKDLREKPYSLFRIKINELPAPTK